MNVPFIWGMRDMKWSLNLWHKDKPVRINIGWRRKYKRRNLTAEGREIEEKEKEEKIKLMEKEVEKQGLIEGHSCLVAFIYESDNNVLS